MSSVPFLDVPYSLAPRVLLSVKTANSMAIAGAVAPLELPLEFVRVLMAFATTRTVRQAFEDWDLDVSLEEFGNIVGNLCKWGLLTQGAGADDGESLQQVLDARVFGDPAALERLGTWMRHGRLVVIRDALPASFAEAVHDDLCTAKTWSTIEGGHDFFHFRTSALSRMEENGSALAQCARVFKSKATRRFIAELSGHDCAGEPGITATWCSDSRCARRIVSDWRRRRSRRRSERRVAADRSTETGGRSNSVRSDPGSRSVPAFS